jgi:hypothetical protein
MQALLHMIETEDDLRRAVAVCSAQQMTIVHRRSHQELDETIIRQGWFISNGFWILGLGPTFGDHWQLTGRADPQAKPFTGLRVHFAGTCWDMPREVQESLINRGGGRVVDAQERADVIVVTPRQHACLSAPTATMIVPERYFSHALSAMRLLAPAWPPKGDVASVWGFISSDDWVSIQQGLSFAGVLAEEIDTLLEGVDVNEQGEIFRGPHFNVTGDAAFRTNRVLLDLLSVAPSGTRAAERRASVRTIAMNIEGIPKLEGFESLEELDLILSPDTTAVNLSTFGPLPALRRLTIAREPHTYDSYYKGRWARLDSLDGLEAPLLEYLSIRALGVRNIDALELSPRLQSVNLQCSWGLKSIEPLTPSAPSLSVLDLDGCPQLESISPLKGATQLQQVHLRNCSSLVSLKPLSGCHSIGELVIEGCSKLTSLEGIGHLSANGTEFSLKGCSSLTSLSELPALAPTITMLNIDETRTLSHLTGTGFARDITTLSAANSGLIDLTARCALPHLEEIHLSSCRRLKSLEGLPSTVTRMGGDKRDTIDLNDCKCLTSLSALAGTDVVKTATRIDLDGCFELTTLAGLEEMRWLDTACLPPTITDASALADRRRSLKIKISLEGSDTFPASLARAIAQIPKVKLSLRSAVLEDCSSLAAMTSLIELDLLECPNVRDISWVVGLPKLKWLRLAAASPAAVEAKNTYFDQTEELRQMTQGRCTCAIYELQQARYTTTKIHELQRAICIKENIPLPPHLATIPAAEAGVLLATLFQPGNVEVGGLRPGLNDLSELQGMIV